MDYAESAKKLSIDEVFGTYYFNAFRYITKELIPNEPNSVVFMADINDLYALNQLKGKIEANKAIEDILSALKDLFASIQKDVNIAKLGDEIYIYLHDCNDQEIEKIAKQIKSIHVKGLTFSLGHARFTDGTFGSGIDKAEKEMIEDKRKYKEKVLEEVFGDNIFELLKHIINERFMRSRFDLNKMSREQILQLRKGLQAASEKLDLLYLSSTKMSKPEVESETMDFINQHITHIEKYKARSIQKYGEINSDYVLTKSIGIDVEPECISDIYFNKVVLNEPSQKKYLGKNLLMVRLSGIKRVNETYGHDICDKKVREIVQTLKKMFKDNGIRRSFPFVIRGAKEIYTFIESSDNLSNVLSQINEIVHVEGRLLATASLEKIPDKLPTSEKNISEYVQNVVLSLIEKMDKEKYTAKINSPYHIEHFLRSLRNKFLSNSIVKAKTEINPELEKELIEYATEYIRLIMNERLTKFDSFAKETTKSNESPDR